MAHFRKAAWIGLLALLVTAGLLGALHHVLCATHDPDSCLVCSSLQVLGLAAAPVALSLHLLCQHLPPPPASTAISLRRSRPRSRSPPCC